jgi:hypothetical protein
MPPATGRGQKYKASFILHLVNKVNLSMVNFAAEKCFLTNNSPMTQEDILKALSNVQEPDLGQRPCDVEYGERCCY